MPDTYLKNVVIFRKGDYVKDKRTHEVFTVEYVIVRGFCLQLRVIERTEPIDADNVEMHRSRSF